MHKSRLAGSAVCLLLLIVALWHTGQLFWICDDAFISLRYAQNLVRGEGLVFNVGERVEGYTNFSWTLLAALGMALGFDAVVWIQVLGAACYAATLLVLSVGTRELRGAHGPAPWLPIAALGLAAHEHAKSFASCGLETALFALLGTAQLVALVHATRARAFAGAGLLGILATMTRPDGALFYVAGGGLALLGARRSRSWSVLLAYAAPFVLLYLPYFAWKWTYYGDPLPNTFYAKSGGAGWIEQGLLYLRLYFASYYVLLPALLGIPILLWARRGSSLAPGWNSGRAPLLLALFGVPYLAFVVWVGGDFMFARFLIPITPVLYLALELFARAMLPARGVLIAAALIALGSALPYRHAGLTATGADGAYGISGIGEERAVYTAEIVERRKLAALRLRELCAGVETRVLIVGSQAILAYYGEFDLAIEGASGLTDRYLARRPLATRGRVGHEKGIFQDPADGMRYLRERGVHFRVLQVTPPTTPPQLQHVDFDRGRLELITYSRELMGALKSRGNVRCVDLEAQLDRLIAELGSRSREEIRAQYEQLRGYYFDHNDDPRRERAFLDHLRD